MDILLDRQDGVLTMRQALEHLSRKSVRHRVATGRWQEPHRSVFVTHSGPVSLVQRRWVAVLATGAALGGITATQAGGLIGFTDDSLHLVVQGDRRPRSVPAGVRIHRASVLDHSATLAAGRPPRTRPARSVVDAAQWAPTEGRARAVIAAAFQQRIINERAISEVLSRLSRVRRRELITQTVADAAGGAQSLAEIDFITLCRTHGLPAPSLQVFRRDAAGRRRYLDALFERWRVQIEIDGGQHLEVRAAWADMRRQNDLWIAGERVLRFPAWAVRHDPAAVMQQLRAALTAAGWSEQAL